MDERSFGSKKEGRTREKEVGVTGERKKGSGEN